MGDLLVPKMLDMLSRADASVDGQHFVLRLPLGQLGALILMFGIGLGVLWVTTRDVKTAVSNLEVTVNKLIVYKERDETRFDDVEQDQIIVRERLEGHIEGHD
jgi:hypothetical protein